MLAKFINTWWLRWIIFILIGILVKFLLDATYSLMFRNYTLLQPFIDYVYACILAILSLESVHQLRRYIKKRLLWEDYPVKRFFVQWSLSLLVSLLIVFISIWLFMVVINAVYYVRLQDQIIMAIFILIVITIMILVELSFFLLEKWRFSLAELERFKKENAEFQFESLRSQVNPHFLFNSLNTLSSLVYENQEKAEAFIRELSDVYRYILENRGKELVTLGEEMAVARSYIYLVQLRFDKNLNIKVDIAGQLHQKLIAPLTLQLLIENTVKHNIISQRKPLEVSIYSENNYLVVKNNLQPKVSKDYSSQLGLKNITSRYSFLTNDQALIQETEKEFIVKIPFIEPV